MQDQCIFCGKYHEDTTVEHIIPRMLGNIHYVLPKGVVCAKCNNKFGLIENKVISSDLFTAERQRLGLLRNPDQQAAGRLDPEHMRKFLAKMGFEGLYHSRRALWDALDFDQLLDHLMRGIPSETCHFVENSDSLKFRAVPRWPDRFRLAMNHLSLGYARDGGAVFIQFRIGRLLSTLRLL